MRGNKYTQARFETQKDRGFTLVEVLIVSPLVILIIMGFVGLMVSMVGDVLTSRDRTIMTYNGNQSLDSINQDANYSLQFLSTTGTLTSPQGNPSAAAFTSSQPNTFILRRVATDKKPLDPARLPVYVANTGASPQGCGNEQSSNESLKVIIIYFVKEESLWQRAIVPGYSTTGANQVCSIPWQRNSCSEADIAQAICKSSDTKLMENVSSFTIDYFTNAAATTPVTPANAASAGAARLTINGQKQAAGSTVSVTTSRLIKIFGQ